MHRHTQENVCPLLSSQEEEEDVSAEKKRQGDWWAGEQSTIISIIRQGNFSVTPPSSNSLTTSISAHLASQSCLCFCCPLPRISTWRTSDMRQTLIVSAAVCCGKVLSATVLKNGWHNMACKTAERVWFYVLPRHGSTKSGKKEPTVLLTWAAANTLPQSAVGHMHHGETPHR